MKQYSILFLLSLSFFCLTNSMERKTHWNAAAKGSFHLMHVERCMLRGRHPGLTFPDGRMYVAISAGHWNTPTEDFATRAFMPVVDSNALQRNLKKHIDRFGSIDSPAPFLTNERGERLLATLLQVAALANNWNAIHGLIAEGADINATTRDVPETPLELLFASGESYADAYPYQNRDEIHANIQLTWDQNVASGLHMRETVTRERQLEEQESALRRSVCINNSLYLVVAALMCVIVLQNMGSGS